METFGIASVVVITVICYLIGMALKAWDAFDDRKIPVIMGFAGAILGILAWVIAPAVIPADDVFTAMAIGIVSGFAATGVNQLYKQATKEG